MSRPSTFTPILAERICARLASGLSLRKLCEADDMPSIDTVRRWLLADVQFQGQYARARAEQAEHYAEEIVEIADTEPDAARARNRIDARKWTAVKLLPKKYGEKLEVGGRLTLEQLVGASLAPTE